MGWKDYGGNYHHETSGVFRAGVLEKTNTDSYSQCYLRVSVSAFSVSNKTCAVVEEGLIIISDN